MLHSKVSSRDSVFQIKLEGKHDFEEHDVLVLRISNHSIFTVVKSTRYHLHLFVFLPSEKLATFDSVWDLFQAVKEPTQVKLRKLSTLVTAFRELTALETFDAPDFELNQHIIQKVESTINEEEGLNSTTILFQDRLNQILNPSQV